MNEMIKSIKQIHDKDVCLFRMGGFYHTFGNDSNIISYFLGYKVRDIEGGMTECGFPVDSISKILRKLEDNKINYVIIDKRNNYNVEEKENYRNLNRYNKFAEKAKIYVNCKKRIDKINQYLMNNIYDTEIKDVISNMENVIKSKKAKV